MYCFNESFLLILYYKTILVNCLINFKIVIWLWSLQWKLMLWKYRQGKFVYHNNHSKTLWS